MKGNNVWADASTRAGCFDKDGNQVAFKISNSVLHIWDDYGVETITTTEGISFKNPEKAVMEAHCLITCSGQILGVKVDWNTVDCSANLTTALLHSSHTSIPSFAESHWWPAGEYLSFYCMYPEIGHLKFNVKHSRKRWKKAKWGKKKERSLGFEGGESWRELARRRTRCWAASEALL